MGSEERPTAAYLLLLPFLLSGAAALIAQLCWLRSLTVTIGGSSAALNILLITFMGGLAVGARLAPSALGRTRRYLLLYAALEAGLSVYLLLSPWVIEGLSEIFVRWLPTLGHETLVAHAARLLLAGLALSLPTIAMGLTTPILIAAAVSRLRETASFTGLLYGVNTLGAAIGSLGAGIFLILHFGVGTTLAIAAGLNFSAALIALAIVAFAGHQLQGSPTPREHALSTRERAAITPYFLLAAAGGFIGMALEVIFARLLVFMIGSSYYSHTISIAGFLIGIVLGSFTIGIISTRTTPRDRYLPSLFILFGITTLASALLFEHLPMTLQRILVLGSAVDFHPLTIKLIATLSLVVLPAMASGLLLPYLVHLLSQKTRNVGTAASAILFSNTLGGVLGVALTGYVLIEAVGVRNALFGMAALIFALGLYSRRLTPTEERGKSRLPLALAGAGLAIAVLLIPLRGGIPLITHSVLYNGFEDPQILFYEEDEGASVSVVDVAGGTQRVLLINGLSAAELDSRFDRLVGVTTDIAMASHPNPRSIFIAGIGAGKNAGVAGLYPGTEVDAVEISRAVIDALPNFDEYTYDLTQNEDVRIIQGDARHFLRSTDRKYDIILPDVFISALTGTSYLYNLEFFELCSEHLAPSGRVVMNVYPGTAIDRTIISGFMHAFPYSVLLQVRGLHFSYLVGSNDPIVFPERPWGAWLDTPAVLRRVHALRFGQVNGLGSFPAESRERTLERLGDPPVSTDDHPIVDYLHSNSDQALIW